MARYADVPFVECQVILAAQEADLAEVDRLLATMLPHERQLLADGCQRLIDTINHPEFYNQLIDNANRS